MNSQIPHVLTVEETAEILRSPRDAVISEFEGGRLPGFKIGSDWRITEPALSDFLGLFQAGDGAAGSKMRPGAQSAHVLFWKGIQLEWQEAKAFDYRWPTPALQPKWIEKYSKAFTGTIRKDGKMRGELLIGFTTREAAGMPERRRVTIFFRAMLDQDNPATTLYPLVEFAGANDYETSRLLASVIKLPSRKQLRKEEPVPEDYQGFKLAVYSEVVIGPSASNSLAVVVRDDDLDGMAKHALIRLKSNPRLAAQLGIPEA